MVNKYINKVVLTCLTVVSFLFPFTTNASLLLGEAIESGTFGSGIELPGGVVAYTLVESLSTQFRFGAAPIDFPGSIPTLPEQYLKSPITESGTTAIYQLDSNSINFNSIASLLTDGLDNHVCLSGICSPESQILNLFYGDMLFPDLFGFDITSIELEIFSFTGKRITSFSQDGELVRRSTIGSMSIAWRFYGVQSSVVPIPAGVWLFGSGAIGLIGMTRTRRKVSNPNTTYLRDYFLINVRN